MKACRALSVGGRIGYMWHGSLWELLLLLAFYLFMLIIFVALPVGLVGYVVLRVIQHREVKEDKKAG
jgi:hypothetical protein